MLKNTAIGLFDGSRNKVEFMLDVNGRKFPVVMDSLGDFDIVVFVFEEAEEQVVYRGIMGNEELASAFCDTVFSPITEYMERKGL